MAEGAALLVDHVLPAVGYRQWVLSFTGPMAVRLGYDRELLAAVSGRLARAVLQDIRRAVKREHGLASVASLHGGVVTVVQRFRSDLGLCRTAKAASSPNAAPFCCDGPSRKPSPARGSGPCRRGGGCDAPGAGPRPCHSVNGSRRLRRATW